MPLRTQINEGIIRASILLCPKALLMKSRHLLNQQLQEIDHQTTVLAGRRARIIQMLADMPTHEESDNT